MKKITLLLMVLIGLATTSWAQCSANFSYVDNGGGNVTFTNTSTGAGSAWIAWDLDDGSFAYSNTFNHNYVNGTYLVCLTIQDSSQNCYDTFCDTVTITSGSNCNLAFTSSQSGSTITTNNLSTGASSYDWYVWGPNNYFQWIPNTTNLTHTVPTNGTYSVCLYGFNGAAFCDSICSPITVTGAGGGGCSAAYTMSNSGATFDFTNSSTGGYSYSYWDFGDGNTSTNNSPIHTYTTTGYYTVCLTISDSLQNCFDTYCDSIYVNANTGGGCNLNFSLSASGTTISGNNTSTGPYSYDWYIWDAAGFFDHIPNTTQLTYTVPTGGNYTVCLYGFDSTGAFCDSTCQNITVVGQGTGCNANFSFMVDSLGNNILVNNSTSAGPVDYFWDFGDGSTGTGATPAPHTYNSPGLYVVCLTISDSMQNCYDTFCDSIFIPQNGLTTVYFSNNTSVGIDEVVESVTGLNVFPNPVSNQATIAFNTAYSGKVELQVFNTTGQLVSAKSLHLTPGAQQIQLEASDFTKGVYFVRLQTERKEHFQTKFIKY